MSCAGYAAGVTVVLIIAVMMVLLREERHDFQLDDFHDHIRAQCRRRRWMLPCPRDRSIGHLIVVSCRGGMEAESRSEKVARASFGRARLEPGPPSRIGTEDEMKRAVCAGLDSDSEVSVSQRVSKLAGFDSTMLVDAEHLQLGGECSETG